MDKSQPSQGVQESTSQEDEFCVQLVSGGAWFISQVGNLRIECSSLFALDFVATAACVSTQEIESCRFRLHQTGILREERLHVLAEGGEIHWEKFPDLEEFQGGIRLRPEKGRFPQQ